jgi:hypothetical protein
MKGSLINIGKFSLKDHIKANKKASREISLQNSTGWVSSHKVHKTEKNYTRKMKHKSDYFI